MKNTMLVAMTAMLLTNGSTLTAQIAPTAPTPLIPGQVVGTGGVSTLGNTTNWTQKVLGGAYAEVTTRYGCGTQLAPNAACSGGFANVGNGALELGVTGNPWGPGGEFGEWGFYRYRPEGGFGSLSALTNLSFDWFREGITGWNAPTGADGGTADRPINPGDWVYKTPVFQIELSETRADGTTAKSMLVWEGYWNKDRLTGAGNTTPVDTWVRQEMLQRDNFWYVRLDTNPDAAGIYGKADGTCSTAMEFWEGTAKPSTIFNFGRAGGCLDGASAYITGIGVGVGSQWPLAWRGAVDNIRVEMNGTQYLNTNFDFVPQSAVPEPSTYALMGAGLLAMAAMARRRRPTTATPTAAERPTTST